MKDECRDCGEPVDAHSGWLGIGECYYRPATDVTQTYWYRSAQYNKTRAFNTLMRAGENATREQRDAFIRAGEELYAAGA
jgi:hypothetical protein